MFTDREMSEKKKKVVYLYDGLLLSNKKIRTTDTQNHMDELKKKKILKGRNKTPKPKLLFYHLYERWEKAK